MFFGCCFQVLRLFSKCHNSVSAVALSLWKDCFYDTLDASYAIDTRTVFVSFLTPVQQGWMLLSSVWIYFSQEQSKELLISLRRPLFPTEKKPRFYINVNVNFDDWAVNLLMMWLCFWDFFKGGKRLIASTSFSWLTSAWRPAQTNWTLSLRTWKNLALLCSVCKAQLHSSTLYHRRMLYSPQTKWSL